MRNLLFALLIVLFVVLGISAIIQHKVTKIKKLFLIILSFSVAAILLYCWWFPAWKLPATTGSYEVDEVCCIIVESDQLERYQNDGSLRKNNVQFWFPKVEHETFPLIIFSHGSFGVKESNETTFRELASHGYVVASIDHAYHSLNSMNFAGRRIALSNAYRSQILRASDKNMKKREELQLLFQEWMEIRMGDINSLLDFVHAQKKHPASDAYPVLNYIDDRKVGIMGHSLGGSASLGIGRTRQDVQAIVALEAPFMYDVKGLTEDGFVFDEAPYPLPLLSVYSDSSWSILREAAQYRQNYTVITDQLADTYDIYVAGAGHMTLTDLAYTMPPLCLLFGQDWFFDVTAYMQRINQTYVEFFDYALKDAPSFAPETWE